MKARYLKDVSDKFNGSAGVWELDEPIKYPRCWGDDCHHCVDNAHKTTSHVVASATVAMFSGPETYLFASDSDGNVLDWMELEGSYRGELNQQKAIDNLVAS